MYKYLVILFFLLISFSVYAQIPQIDSLKNVVNSAEDDTSKVNNLILLSGRLCRTNPQEAILYGTKAKELAEKIEFQKGLAYALKSIGMGYYFQGNYVDGVMFWQQSYNTFETIGDKLGMSNMLNNIGAIYFNQGDDMKAIEYYLASLKISEEINDTLRIATALVNIGSVYIKPKTYQQALQYLRRSLPLSKALGDQDAIGTSAVNIGEIYLKEGELDSAFYYFEISLEAYKQSETGNVSYTLNNIGRVYAERGQFDKAMKYQKEAFEIASNINAKLEMAQALIGLANTSMKMNNLSASINYFNQAKELATEIAASYELEKIYDGLARSYAETTNYKLAYENQSLLTSIKETLYNAQMDKSIQALTLSSDIQKMQSQINILTKESELTELSIQKQKLVRNALIACLVLIFIIALEAYRNFRIKSKSNILLDKQKLEIEKLLLNILPEKVAEELQQNGTATPKNYDNVSVLFTDFKEFSKISENLQPKDLIAELNLFFNSFDNIIEKYNLEKIKTIGDSYMCAGGVPNINQTHASDAIRAGLEIQEFIKQTNEKRKAKGETEWNLRIGIHSGPVVAGVVGNKKYAFDIWGSTVNTASRMESMGEIGKVNISAATYELTKDVFNFQSRGKILAKNIGDLEMYFVEYKKS